MAAMWSALRFLRIEQRDTWFTSRRLRVALRVAHRVGDVFLPQVVLKRARVVPVVGELEAASVPEL